MERRVGGPTHRVDAMAIGASGDIPILSDQRFAVDALLVELVDLGVTGPAGERHLRAVGDGLARIVGAVAVGADCGFRVTSASRHSVDVVVGFGVLIQMAAPAGIGPFDGERPSVERRYRVVGKGGDVGVAHGARDVERAVHRRLVLFDVELEVEQFTARKGRLETLLGMAPQAIVVVEDEVIGLFLLSLRTAAPSPQQHHQST